MKFCMISPYAHTCWHVYRAWSWVHLAQQLHPAQRTAYSIAPFPVLWFFILYTPSSLMCPEVFFGVGWVWHSCPISCWVLTVTCSQRWTVIHLYTNHHPPRVSRVSCFSFEKRGWMLEDIYVCIPLKMFGKSICTSTGCSWSQEMHGQEIHRDVAQSWLDVGTWGAGRLHKQELRQVYACHWLDLMRSMVDLWDYILWEPGDVPG